MIVLIATYWSSAAGGISAFNLALARALGQLIPGDVACAIIGSATTPNAWTEEGVLLVPVSADKEAFDRPDADCGQEIVAALRESEANVTVDHWIGHDLVTGYAAIRASERYGGSAVVVHHMDYLAYLNLSGGRGDDTTAKHEQQIDLFSRCDLALGVGARLTRTAAELGAQHSVSIIPGFPAIKPPAGRKRQVLSAVTAGRFDARSDAVKQVGLAVAGFGRAIRTAGALIDTLPNATLTALGTDGHERQIELEALAVKEAGRSVKLVPAKFNPDPASVAKHLSRANLAIMPSRHEGFGLIGWEAIGTGTPLILGADTGLAEQLKELSVTGDGLAQVLSLTGNSSDKDLVRDAIVNVARDIPRALRKAEALRDALIADLGCTWTGAACTLLDALGVRRASSPSPRSAPGTVHVRCRASDRFPETVELALAAGQGATPSLIELIAEIRFGSTEVGIDGIEAEISLTRARLKVVPQPGRLDGVRLGDPQRPVAGIQAQAGGVWLLTADGNPLSGKILGDETLCRIEAPGDQVVGARVEVTAAKRDLTCAVRSRGRRLKGTTEKVLGVFLKNAVFKDDSGHVLLSSASIGKDDDPE